MIFDDRYGVFLADTRESRNLHFNLRYKVYFEETGWEKNSVVAQKRLEQDKFDSYSVHFLVYDYVACEWMAGMRLVVSKYNDLPMARCCNLELDSSKKYETDQCVEVSRLFVLPDYRCGKKRSSDRADGGRNTSERAHSEIMLGLIRAAREYGLQSNLKSWFFLVESPLARRIQRLGIDLIPCGEAINHRGVRMPFYGEVGECFNPLFSSGSVLSAMFSKTDTYRLCSKGLPYAGEKSAHIVGC